MTIDRHFVRIGHGQIHYRSAGAGGVPLVMAHGGPGSSAGLVSLMEELSPTRHIVAPDMMGNGESDPPPEPATSIAFYADCLLDVMDRLGLPQANLYGHHAGAQVVCELAIAQPARVRRVVLDGVGLFTPTQLAEYANRYAPPLVPDADGSHLAAVWTFVTNTTLYFPHYRADREHALSGGVAMPPDSITSRAAEVLKVWRTYHLSYGASFRHKLRERLALVPAPALVLEISGDPLARYAREAAGLMPNATVRLADRASRGAAIRKFLDAPDP